MLWLKIKEEIRNVWFGRVKLWKVFWIHASLLATALSFIIDILFFTGNFFASIAMLGFYTIFMIWVSKGIYSCRLNVKNPQGIIPKIAIIFAFANFIFFMVSLPRFFNQIQQFREDPESLQRTIEALKNPKTEKENIF